MAKKKSTVLLVEDDPADQQIIIRVVNESGISAKVDVVSSGQKAFDYLAPKQGERKGRGGAYPDLIFLDLNMPGMSGFEVLQRLKGENGTRSIPVIVLSTSDAASDINQSYALGANSYVRKPSSIQGFIDVMRQIELYWLRSVSLPVYSA